VGCIKDNLVDSLALGGIHFAGKSEEDIVENSLSLKNICAIILIYGALAIAASAQTFTSLASFGATNGEYPYFGSLAVGSDGNLYGTTILGGTSGSGTIFDVTTRGVLTMLYSFSSDGDIPDSGLVLGSDGNFYGTTSMGSFTGQGTVFKFTPGGTLTTLYNFCSQSNCSDGGRPQGGLVQGANGNLYGTTTFGGAHDAGTVFEITTTGQLTTLYSFCAQTNCTDGWTVSSALTFASNGKLYGVTTNGGANDWGTVFSITTAGTLTTLHSFASTDGANPFGGLVQASDGNLYGTTSGGGRADQGTVFKIGEAGKLETIYDFCSKAYCADGQAPFGTLIQGSNGNLYGTTEAGGTRNRGTIFEITTKGVLTTLHSFAGADGSSPYAGLVLDSSNGTLYGTTYFGGNVNCIFYGTGCGSVFSLVP
jgi:uncharacterized repeat protein (TIGR03803 family)